MKYKKIQINLVALIKKSHPVIISFLFFVAFATLAIVRHNHYGSFGFDLGIADQIIWKFSQFKEPLNTIYHHPFTSTFTDHIEFLFILISPLYWLIPDVRGLIVLQAFAVALSGMPVYLLARKKGLHPFIAYSLLISYLMFYGIQNALWFDVHSLSLAAGILPWFLYFLDTGRNRLTLLFFFLAIITKEDIALFTFLISFIYFVTTRSKITILLMAISVLYMFLIFFVYFPFFTQDGYRFSNKEGLLSDLNLSYMIDTEEKRKIIFYGLGWFGFLSLLQPLYLIPAFFDLFHYFVLGHDVPTVQTFFMHYRVVFALLLVWPTIETLKKFKKLNNKYIALYLLLCAFLGQYILHLPLSYLTKKWFWTKPQSIDGINRIISFIPKDASVVSQNNITPHISHREEIFTLWPEKKSFAEDSPCGAPNCEWFRWAGSPEYLIVDTGPDWDIRHFLASREDYMKGISNLEKAKIITPVKKQGSATLYKILKDPSKAV